MVTAAAAEYLGSPASAVQKERVARGGPSGQQACQGTAAQVVTAAMESTTAQQLALVATAVTADLQLQVSVVQVAPVAQVDLGWQALLALSLLPRPSVEMEQQVAMVARVVQQHRASQESAVLEVLAETAVLAETVLTESVQMVRAAVAQPMVALADVAETQPRALQVLEALAETQVWLALVAPAASEAMAAQAEVEPTVATAVPADLRQLEE